MKASQVRLDDGIREFQRGRGLKVDGYLKPKGPTIKSLSRIKGRTVASPFTGSKRPDIGAAGVAENGRLVSAMMKTTDLGRIPVYVAEAATRRDKGRAEVVDLFRQLRKASPDSSARLHEGLQSLLETTLHRALYAQAAQEDEDDENPDQPEKPENPNPTPPPEEPKEPEQPKPNPDDPKKPKPEKPDDDKREKCAALAAALRRATIWHQTFADDYAETAKEIPVLREETKAAKLDYDKLLAAFLASLTPGGAAANALRRLGVIGQNAARAIGRASDLATNVPTGLPSEVAAAYEEWQKKKSKLEDAIIHRDYCLEQKNKYSAEMDRIGDEMSENGC